MPRKIILLLFIVSLLLVSSVSCSQKVDTDPDTVNIMCPDYQAKIIGELYTKAFLYDNALKEPRFITEKEYDSFDDWQNALYKNLMTNNPDIDIFFLYNLDENAYKIIRDHYYVDLSQDEVLAKNFDAMYPEVRQWCTYRDEIFGFPFDIDWYTTLLVDEAQTGIIGYDAQDFVTVRRSPSIL